MIHIKQRCISCGTGVLPGKNTDTCPVCGDQEWESLCKKHKKIYSTVACPCCAYRFQDAEFSDPIGLANAFRANWEDATKAVISEPPSHWLRSVHGLERPADLIDKLTRDTALEPDEKLTGIMLILDPENSLWWRGQELNTLLLDKRPELAARIVESSLPELCKPSARHAWLPQIQESWLSFRDEVNRMKPMIGSLPSHTSLVSLRIGNTTAESVADALPLLGVALAFNAGKLSRSLESRFIASPPVTPPSTKATTRSSGDEKSGSDSRPSPPVVTSSRTGRTDPLIEPKDGKVPNTSEIEAKKLEPIREKEPSHLPTDPAPEDTKPTPTENVASGFWRSTKRVWAAAKSIISKIKHGG